jgi:quercetin dioxygenase-like cupin family protein
MAITHTRPGEVSDVRPLGPKLRQTQSVAILKAEQLEILRVVLLAGKEWREHQVPGEITVQCIEGLLEFRTTRSTQLLRPGELIHLSTRELHALKAIDDSSALVTLCLRPNGG